MTLARQDATRVVVQALVPEPAEGRASLFVDKPRQSLPAR